MFGNVNNRSDRRPKVSIVQMAGCDQCKLGAMTSNRLRADSYPGKDKIDQTETETCNQGIALTGASLSEHGGAVEG
jgi:hypothetical protein